MYSLKNIIAVPKKVFLIDAKKNTIIFFDENTGKYNYVDVVLIKKYSQA